MAEMDISKDVSVMENSDNKHNEILLQENHSLKKKIGNLEYLVNVLKEDNDTLQKEKSNLCDSNEEEKSVSSKLKIENKRLENNLDDVKNEFGKYKEDIEKEKSERTKDVPAQSCSCKSNNSNEDTLQLTFELNDVKFENEKLKSDLERCEQMYQLKINHLNEKINSLQSECDEMKQLLKNKTQQFSDAAASLEAVKEEKLILSSELAALKASPADVNIRGNSLFAEVEDKRKEMGSKLKMMYTKYMQLKRSYLQKNNDLRRLKEDYITLQQRISDDEEMRVKADKRLIAAQDATIKDLQKTIRILEKRPETPQIVTLKDDVHFAWVQGIVDIARKEAAELRTELHLNSVNQWLLEQEIHKKTSELLQSHDKIRELTAEIARCKLNNEQFTGNDTETIASTSVTNMNSKKSTNQEKVVLRENNNVQNDMENILPTQKRTVQFKEIEN